MILFINILIGFVLAFGTSRLNQLKESVQGEIFCGAFYLLEIIECIFKHTIKIYINSVIISIILLIILPFMIFFVFYAIKSIRNSK